MVLTLSAISAAILAFAVAGIYKRRQKKQRDEKRRNLAKLDSEAIARVAAVSI